MIKDSQKGLFDVVLVWKLDRFARNRYDSAKEKAKINYLLSTKLFYGKCGALMLGESGYGYKNNMYHYYKCANTKRRKTCDKKSVRKDWIEDLVINLTYEEKTPHTEVSYIKSFRYAISSG